MRFSIPTEAPLRPFVIAAAPDALRLPQGVRVVDPFESGNAAFCRAMNRANCLAYDGTPEVGTCAGALGMPAWVMLDCCLLPAGVFGFETRREFVPKAFAAQLDPDESCEWIGVSEYVALPSTRESEVVGVSLFSFVEGHSLGRRTKALALASLGARTQTGVTQWTSPGLPLHVEFGELRVVTSSVPVHNRAAETFVYRVALPDRDALLRMFEGDRGQRVLASAVATIDPRGADVEGWLRARGRSPVIVGCGPLEGGRVTQLTFRFDEG